MTLQHESGGRLLVTQRSLRAGGLALVLFAGVGVAAVGQAEDPGVEVTIERTLDASVTDIQANAPRWVEELRESVKALTRLDEAARRGRGGSGLECVTTNLEAAKSLEQVAGAALTTIETAIAEGDQARASFEYRKIAIAVKRGRDLQAEGERCALGEGVRDGQTRRELTGAPSDVVDETRGMKDDIVEWAFDPPDASPF